MAQLKSELDRAQRATFEAHMTAPFCWLERPGGALEALGAAPPRATTAPWPRSQESETEG